MSKSKKKAYVVWAGLEPGLYHTWLETNIQILGIQGAKFKGFESLEVAKKELHRFDHRVLPDNDNAKRLRSEWLTTQGKPWECGSPKK